MENEVTIPCRICNLQFKGYKQFEAHAYSQEHAAAVNFSKLSPSKPIVDPNDYYLDGHGIFFCKVCNISVTGIVPWEQHLIGQQHMKKLKNRAALDIFNKSQVIQHEVASTPVKSSPLFSRTTPDKNPMNIKISINRGEHVVSSPFPQQVSSPSEENDLGKKMESMTVTDSLENSPSTLSLYDSSSFPFKCDACCKRFTGIESYQQHVISPQHLKKKEQEVACFPKAYYCDICGVSLSGPIPYKQHLESIKHAKKVLANSAALKYSPAASDGLYQSSVVSKKQEEQLLYRQFTLSQPSINVALHLGENQSSSTENLNIISADEPFKLPVPKSKKKEEETKGRIVECDVNRSDDDDDDDDDAKSYRTCKT